MQFYKGAMHDEGSNGQIEVFLPFTVEVHNYSSSGTLWEFDYTLVFHGC